MYIFNIHSYVIIHLEFNLPFIGLREGGTSFIDCMRRLNIFAVVQMLNIFHKLIIIFWVIALLKVTAKNNNLPSRGYNLRTTIFSRCISTSIYAAMYY